MMRLHKRFCRIPIAILCQLLLLSSGWAQQPAASPDLRIVIVEGEGARNQVQQLAARPLVVRIEDANRRPVSGATVLFNAPAAGASGQFENSTTIQTTSGETGLASPGVFHPNGIVGRFQILVVAEFQGQMAMAFISQRNIGENSGRRKWIAIGAVIAAAGASIALKSKNGGTPSNVPTITLEGATVGAPR